MLQLFISVLRRLLPERHDLGQHRHLRRAVDAGARDGSAGGGGEVEEGGEGLRATVQEGEAGALPHLPEDLRETNLRTLQGFFGGLHHCRLCR